MRGRKEMSLVFERIVVPAGARPERLERPQPDARLDVAVVFTSADATIVALKRAGTLADSLNARVLLMVPQVVPFPLPLDSPPVLIDFNEKRFREIASASPIETAVRIYLCRDSFGALTAALKPPSLVVVGGRKRWWSTTEEIMARKLRRAGHEVVFAETE
jgi:hypothetical protein